MKYKGLQKPLPVIFKSSPSIPPTSQATAPLLLFPLPKPHFFFFFYLFCAFREAFFCLKSPFPDSSTPFMYNLQDMVKTPLFYEASSLRMTNCSLLSGFQSMRTVITSYDMLIFPSMPWIIMLPKTEILFVFLGLALVQHLIHSRCSHCFDLKIQ